jgi:hypothetical protein
MATPVPTPALGSAGTQTTRTSALAPQTGVYGLMGGTASPDGATYQSVDPNALTSAQLQGLLSSDSPYIQGAVAAGQRQAGSTGQLNGSMAAGSAENAAIAAGLPIAQANAQQLASIANANQTAANQYTGENIAADAQVNAATAGNTGWATVQSAQINAATQAAAQKQQAAQFSQSQAQQYGEFGQMQGLQYAQLGQQGTQFNQQLAQSGQEFNVSQANQMTQFGQNMAYQQKALETSTGLQAYGISANMSLASINAGVQMQSAVLSNPNLTADQRTAALATVNSQIQNYQSQVAAIPAYIPGWTSDPNFWTF